MKRNETVAARRRIEVVLETSADVPVTGSTPSSIQVSKSGSAWTAAGGTFVEVSDGDYYYEATQAESDTDAWLLLRVDSTGDGARMVVIAEDIGERIHANETTGAARRIPIYLEDSSGNPVAPGSLSSVEFSANGAAYTSTGVTSGSIGLGAFYVELPAAAVTDVGYVSTKVIETGALPYIYSQDVIPELVAPTIAAVSPTPSTAPGAPGGFSGVYATATITDVVVRVEDDAVAFIVIFATLDGGQEVPIFQDGAFLAGWTSFSYIDVVDPTTTDYYVRPDVGWVNVSVVLRFDVVDASGTYITDEFEWLLPQIVAFPPAPLISMPGVAVDSYKAKLMRRTLPTSFVNSLQSGNGRLLAVIAAEDEEIGGLFDADPLPSE